MLRSSQFNIYVALAGTPEVVIVNGLAGTIDIIDAELAGHLQHEAVRGCDTAVSALLPQAVSYLLDRGYLTHLTSDSERARFREEAKLREMNESIRPRKFYLIPTYACQLRCTYCFEHEVRSQGRHEGWEKTQIQPDVVESAFSAMESIAGNDRRNLQCTLFGGEALLPENRLTVQSVVKTAARRGFGLMAATNAFDLQDYEDLLGPRGIAGLHVPIDGIEAIHDRMRVAKGGAPTFRRIVNNLKMALRRGVRVRLRINVNAASLAELDALADLLENEGFIDHPRFSSYIKAIFPSKHGSTQSQQLVVSEAIRKRLLVPTTRTAVPARGLITDADVALRISSSERLSRFFSGYPVIHDKVTALFTARPNDALRPSHCGTSSLQVLIFDPRGDIYPCNNLVGRAQYKVGTFHPALEWNEDRATVWRERTVASMEDVVTCKYAMFCGGGCAFDAAVAHGSVRAKSCDCDNFATTFAGLVASSYNRIVRHAPLQA